MPCSLHYCDVHVCLFVLQPAYLKAKEVAWKVGGSLAGQVKAGGGLTFAAVEKAGHMVPMDQPQSVSNLIM